MLKKSASRQPPKSQATGLVAKPVSRIQTAEGWRRSQIRRRKSMKVTPREN